MGHNQLRKKLKDMFVSANLNSNDIIKTQFESNQCVKVVQRGHTRKNDNGEEWPPVFSPGF